MFDKLRQIEERYASSPPALRSRQCSASRPSTRASAKAAAELAETVETLRRVQGRAQPASPRPATSWPRTATARCASWPRPRSTSCAAGRAELEERAAGAAPPPRSQRRQERLRRDPRGRGRRRGRAVRRRPRPHVHQVRRAPAAGRSRCMDSHRHRRRRVQGSHPVHPGQGRLEPAQVRARRAPRAARARHRVEPAASTPRP